MKAAGYEYPVIRGFSSKVIQRFKGKDSGNIFDVTDDVLDDLAHSVKFALGESDSLPKVCALDDGRLRTGPIRLPFDLMTIELTSNEGDDGDHDAIAIFKRTSSTVVRVFMFGRRHGQPNWFHSPTWAEVDCGDGIRRFSAVGADFLRKQENGEALVDAAQRTAIDACSSAMLALESLHALIACNNVKVETVPAPKTGKGQRLGKRKRELLQFEYRILTIDGRPAYDRKSHGNHRSPRLHLRRGHIRRLPSGKTTWVSSCAVGSGRRGTIQKDYAVGAPE